MSGESRGREMFKRAKRFDMQKHYWTKRLYPSQPVGGYVRKFGKYPVVINFNLHTQLRSKFEVERLDQARLYEQERRLSIKTNTTSDSTLEKNLWKDEIKAYEDAVYGCLEKICTKPVGRMVLGLINPSTTVWIIPKPDKELNACRCATTEPLKYEILKDGVARGRGYGDTVISFSLSPELGDDALFHELVHAYRYSYKKYDPFIIDVRSGALVKGKSLREKQSTEEFFALQMTNIYLSQANQPLLADYTWQYMSTKDEIYDFLVANIDVMRTVKYFLNHEYLAMLAANSFPVDHNPYNPFRDFAELEKRVLKDHPSLPTLPELGTKLGH
jgi:hypothetical protein